MNRQSSLLFSVNSTIPENYFLFFSNPMKAFFEELFQYNHHFNQEILAVASKNPDQVSEKCISLLSHIVNAHQIWNGKLYPEMTVFDRWEAHTIQQLAEIDQQNFECSLKILDQFDLNQIIQYATSKGHIFNHSVRDILFQAINHSTYHRAQVATEFRQCGLEPLLTDYIYYKMIQNP
jgi:uncharacterized damage-inducible protein DinB